jgi:hypothetical protein
MVKHIVLVLVGLCVILVVQTRLPVDGSHATALTLAAVSIGGVILAFVGANLTRRHEFVWIVAPAAIYATTLIALITRANQFSGAVLAASAVAIFVMAGTAWFAARAARLVHEVDELGALLLFEGQLKSAKSPDDYRLCGQKLLAQCHRHHRPLAVIAVEWRIPEEPEGKTETGIAARLAMHVRRHELIAGITDALRTSDLMLSGDRANRCFLVCPDTDLVSVIGFCARLDAAIAKRLPAKITFGVAHFGEAGYELDELLAAAADRLASARSRPVSQPASNAPATLPELVPSPARNWARETGGSSVTRTAG